MDSARKILRNSLLVFFLIAISTQSHGQRIDLANGEKTFQRTFSKVIGQTEKGMYVLRSTNAFNNRQEQIRLRDNKIEIAFLENNLSTKWISPLVLPETDGEIQDIQFIDDSLYVFYATSNRAKSQLELKAAKISISNGKVSGAAIIVDSLNYDRRKNKVQFYIKKSRDAKSFAVMYKTGAEDEKMSIHCTVMDSAFQKRWSRSYQTEYFEGVLFLNDFKLNNNGTIYLLTSLDLDKKTLRDKKFSINIADSANTNFTILPLGLEKNYITDIKMELDYINQQIVLAGFYSEMNSFSSAGLFYVSVPFQGGIPQVKKESFKAKFLTEFNTERTVNRGTELINYFVDKLILRTDGGVILVAESNYITESTNYNSYYQLYTTSYTYHYDNVLLFSVNPNGKIHWESIVRKNQISEDDAAFYSSYILLLEADKAHIIFNKFIRKSTDVICNTINNKGEVTEKVLLKETENILIMPGGGKQISADQVLIPCIQKNKTNFIRVSF